MVEVVCKAPRLQPQSADVGTFTFNTPSVLSPVLDTDYGHKRSLTSRSSQLKPRTSGGVWTCQDFGLQREWVCG